ncbi:ATPase family protein associated with various cellular activities (AAA) [Thioflavicoccus mobilis 8321]|uniref:ATPase family protein associated with various cellular activities (AAA) n=2 Tax=Thioflavicoccus mobilis TaxID=80679 RepID=L0GWQ9_9GAMM|nr:ATPase family protein associated with various cellular activities (AAA) [Thioflavicoccus mobilis 8321]
MPDDMKSQFAERLAALDEALSDLGSKREDLDRLLAEAKQTETDLAEARADHEQKQTQLAERERQLNDREKAIELRELDARNGFLEQQRDALKTLRDEIRRLEAERDQVIARTEQEEREVRERIDAMRAAQRDAQQADKDALAQDRQALEEERQKLALERKHLEQARRNEEGIKRQIRQALEDEHKREIDELKREIYQARRNAGADAKTIQEQRQALEAVADLNRLLEHHGFADAEALLQRFDDLRSENRQLREDQRHRSDDDLEAENEALRERCDDYEQRLEDQARQINALKNEVGTRRVSVLEKQALEQEKRVLEQHKRALDSAVIELEQRLDDLTTRQQGRSAFEALAKMDKDLVGGTPVDEVPALDVLAQELRQRIAGALDAPLYYPEQVIRLFLGGLAMSQLHILQGISGTGKTSLALAFAKAVGGHCTEVPVQAGWRDRDDLLGHFNAFERRFYERECLQAIYRAGTEPFKDRVNIVLLDEMNLSHPEQYFAELLSALEMPAARRRVVLTESALPDPPLLMRADGCDGRKLALPDNLWFIGTANEDETTKGFADKTFDRAHVMELRAKDEPFKVEQHGSSLPYSFASLRRQFDKAQEQHCGAVEEGLRALQKSQFTRLLKTEFGLGWGNRLERQALRFVPVVMAAGGSLGEGMDHLLATRLFRAGKVTGRFDVVLDTLQNLETALSRVWKEIDPSNDVPVACLERLDLDIRRKEQQG